MVLKGYRVVDLSTETQRLPKHKLDLITAYIQDHLDQELKLVDLAAVVGISQYYFSRLFKQSTGLAPYQYVVQQRVERAKQLLRQQNLTIADIALLCGFANQSHFTKLFRQVTGLTPKQYQTDRSQYQTDRAS